MKNFQFNSRGNGENTPFAKQSREKERDKGHDTMYRVNKIIWNFHKWRHVCSFCDTSTIAHISYSDFVTFIYLQWGLENQTPKSEWHSKTERFWNFDIYFIFQLHSLFTTKNKIKSIFHFPQVKRWPAPSRVASLIWITFLWKVQQGNTVYNSWKQVFELIRLHFLGWTYRLGHISWKRSD